MIKLFADTANLDEIEYCFSRGVNDGITTNPKIMQDTGDLSNGFIDACNGIVTKYPNVPVSLETDLRGINMNNFELEDELKIKDTLLKQAYLLKDLGKNVIIKIPVCKGGLLAAKDLANEGIKTNITACMNSQQALVSSQYGEGYVSMFANRILDSYILKMAGYNLESVLKESNWKEILKENKERYFNQAWEATLNEIAYVSKNIKNTKCELIVGSIRSPEDVYRIASAGPQVITIPTKIVRGLKDIIEIKNNSEYLERNIADFVSVSDPMTLYTLKEFEESANSYRK